MLCWMCDKTKHDTIRNENIREIGVSPIIEKMVEIRLRWFQQVEEILMNFLLRRVN
jgi:hypothetical protein